MKRYIASVVEMLSDYLNKSNTDSISISRENIQEFVNILKKGIEHQKKLESAVRDARYLIKSIDFVDFKNDCSCHDTDRALKEALQ